MIGALTILAAACNQPQGGTPTGRADSLQSAPKEDTASAGLAATLRVPPVAEGRDSLMVTFTVTNNGKEPLRFCKWHTPFEPLMSKYLDVANERGEEADYRGAMAKRIMPPPADSYVTVNPADSLTTSFDLLKGYAVTKPGTYTIRYSGGEISGLKESNTVTFQLK